MFGIQIQLWRGISTLVGTTVGAGMLAIPVVVQTAGFWTGLIVILLVGLAVLLMNLMLGEVVLRTKGNHQLTGYAEKYLGKWGKQAMLVSMLVGIYGALIAYTLGEGASLASLFGGNPAMWSGLFYIVMAGIIFKGLSVVETSESWLSPLKIMLFVILVIFSIASGKLNTTNLSGFSASSLFIPYGVVLFALLGTAAIPEIREETKKHWSNLKKVLIIGSTIPIIIYLLFAIIVIGITGSQTTEIATIGLSAVLGSTAGALINAFAVIAMMTAFMALGLALKEMFMFDYEFSRIKAFVAVVALPVLALVIGLQSFAGMIGVAGAFAGGIDGVLIVLMFWRAKNKGERIPEYSLHTPFFIGVLLILMFILGAVYAFL
ncbi:MAG: aromatic amino acid transport family protein [Candidatus Woesearchaeota archaeon]|nr:aromatic amino acid transport family protein [Candidatus Woesearchaeota archaeon]